MMQMKIRKTISFPEELADKISERAKEGNRSFSAQVVYDMTIMVNMTTTIDIDTFRKSFPPNIEFRESSIEE